MEKFKRTLKQSKRFLIIIGVLWVFLAIVLVSPIAEAIADASKTGVFVLDTFINRLIPAITSFSSITRMFSEEYINTFGSCLMNYTILFIICSIIGFVKSKPKGDYYDMEHGSSDWSEHGEQYRILSKNKGIILAEDNYLPVDKRGNINTLIVGRIWIW